MRSRPEAGATAQQARTDAVRLVADVQPFGRDVIEDDGPGLGCLHWPLTSLAGALIDAPPPPVRTLVLTGQVDLRTPFENALRVALLPQLASSTTVVGVPNVGHSVLTAATCARTIAENFLEGIATRGCQGQKPAYAVRLAPQTVGQLPRPGGLRRRLGLVAAVVDATLRDAIAAAAVAAPGGGAIRIGGLRGGRLLGERTSDHTTLTLKKYALVRGARVAGTVTLDASGTVGRIHALGRVHGKVRYDGHHATVSGRTRDGEPASAAAVDDLVPRLPEPSLPPIP